MIKVGIRVRGLNLRADGAWDALPAALVDLDWDGTGDLVVASVYGASASAVREAALDAARALATVPELAFDGLYDELVGLAEIAIRLDVNPETVRMWADGRRRASRAFPGVTEVNESASGRVVRLYRWRHVVEWARQVLAEDPDEGIEYLDDRSIDLLTAELRQAADASDADFRLELAGQWNNAFSRVDLAFAEATLARLRNTVFHHGYFDADLEAQESDAAAPADMYDGIRAAAGTWIYSRFADDRNRTLWTGTCRVAAEYTPAVTTPLLRLAAIYDQTEHDRTVTA